MTLQKLLLLSFFLPVVAGIPVASQSRDFVQSYTPLVQGMRGFEGPLTDLEVSEAFGLAMADLGDLDGDGRSELAVASPLSTAGEFGTAEVRILSFDADGAISRVTKISEGGLLGFQPEDSARFGRGLAAVGDLDGDGIPDLAVGAPGRRATTDGAIYLLHLRSDGSVKSYTRWKDTHGSETGVQSCRFGRSIALRAGSEPGRLELAVSASLAPDGTQGLVYLLSLGADGTSSAQVVGSGLGGFPDVLVAGDGFGEALACPGDLDGNGEDDLVVGAPTDDRAARRSGAIWVLLLEGGRVRDHQRLDGARPGWEDLVPEYSEFGAALAVDTAPGSTRRFELAVGAPGPAAGANRTGAVWRMTLGPDGTPRTVNRTSTSALGRPLAAGFGGGLTYTRDRGGDGSSDLFVGEVELTRLGMALLGASGGTWLLHTSPSSVVDLDWYGETRLSSLGGAVEALGDLDGDGVGDFAVAAAIASSYGRYRGRVWIVFPRGDGSLADRIEIFPPAYPDGSYPDVRGFGTSLVQLGDLDGNGYLDLGIGCRVTHDGDSMGALQVVLLGPKGEVQGGSEISFGVGNGPPAPHASFRSLARAGDVDGNGVEDLILGAQNGDVWMLFMGSDGAPLGWRSIDMTHIEWNDGWGHSLANVGDLDGDGIDDFAAGLVNRRRVDLTRREGSVLIFFLDRLGNLRRFTELRAGEGGFRGELTAGFGLGLTEVGDVDGDGVPDLLVSERQGGPGNPPCEELEQPPGALWLLFLERDGRVKGHREIRFGTEGFDPPYDGSLTGYCAFTYSGFGTDLAYFGEDEDGLLHVAVSSKVPEPTTWSMKLRRREYRARVRERAGRAGNPRLLRTESEPTLGSRFTATLDCSDRQSGLAVLVAAECAADGPDLGAGSLLVNWEASSYRFLLGQPHLGGELTFSFDLPRSTLLLGHHLTVQGVVLGGPAPLPSNALDLVIGH